MWTATIGIHAYRCLLEPVCRYPNSYSYQCECTLRRTSLTGCMMFIHDQSHCEMYQVFLESHRNFHDLRQGSDNEYAMCKAVGILLPVSSAGLMLLTSTDKHADVLQRCCCHVTVDVLHFHASHLYGKSAHYRLFRATEPQKHVDSWRNWVNE